ncbi:hypothetical protein MSPP1_000826 [Malassezia sp. CBS 17886]|nr:hypothetical protein MSPP1_000826 [Malassezia sp. CBS 17886]
MTPPAYVDRTDPEVHLDCTTQHWVWEDEGSEWEWHGAKPTEERPRQTQGRWLPIVNDEEIQRQQEVYSMAGVDEETPAAPVLKRQARKRKEPAESTGGSADSGAKRTRVNTAVFVTHLPLDADASEIAEVFSRYGVLLEDDQGRPKVKLYYDERTKAFKGEALIVYFKPESVELAVQLLDETHLRANKGILTGPTMHVQKATFQSDGGSDAPAASTSAGKPAAPRTLSEADKKQIRRRMDKMHNKINDWDSDSDDGRQDAVSRDARTVVLKKMFTLAELDADPTLLLDLKMDVREECESHGAVTNVVLWDKEPEGVITVRFQDPSAARSCVQKMERRYFAGRQISAFLVDGKPRFRRSTQDVEEDSERVDAFGDWLERGGG